VGVSADHIIYPDQHVDVSLALATFSEDSVESRTRIYDTLIGVQWGHVIVNYKYSVDCEELITRSGEVALVGGMYAWTWAGKEVPLAVLWERFPRLRDYLRTRTEYFISCKADERDDPWVREQLAKLQDQLNAIAAVPGIPT
jgi:hypothetical protein